MYEFTSPFQEYLHTNYVPSSIDRTQIRQLLIEPEAALAKIDDDINRLQSVIDNIKRQKDSLDETIDGHYQLLTPFRRLPDDMLREIFVGCLSNNHNAVMSTSEAPLLLGRVCSRWRSVAYHTPRLWASLHIPLPIPPSHNDLAFWNPSETYQQMCIDFEQKFQLHCEAVREWLNRSRSCPISVSFDPRDSITTTQNQYIRIYLDILLTFSHRWRSLEISIPPTEYSTLISSIPASSVPKLEFLHLKFSRRRGHENVWTNSGLLKAANLRVLHLGQFPYRLSSLATVNWSQITHLILSHTASPIPRHKKLSIEEAYRVFSRCKKLQHCALDIIDSSDVINPSDLLDLPHLESLAIVDGAYFIGRLIECLYVPALRTIKYHTNLWPSSSRRSPLVLLLLRTNSRVEQITTDLQFFMVSELINCLELAPGLTHLVNKRSRYGVTRVQTHSRSRLPFIAKMMKVILDILLPNSFGQCLCPRLRVLHLKDSLTLCEQDASKFIQERIKASTTLGIERLTEVDITFTREMSYDAYAQLQSYVDDGLKLNFSFPPPPKRASNANFNPINGLVKRYVRTDPAGQWM